MKKRYIILAFLFEISFFGYSQDSHLSQYDMSPVWLNPAQTGMDKDLKFKAGNQSRSQWASSTAKYITNVFSYEMPLDARWGVGGYINDYDAAKILNVFKFVVSGSYQITTDNNKHYLAGGLQIGMIYKNIDEDRMIFDSQWNDGVFDSDLPSNEDLNKYHEVLPEVNLGIYYKFKNGIKKYKPYAGFSIFHATNPHENFTGGEKDNLPMRFQLNGGSLFLINEKLNIEPTALYMRQRNAFEFIGGSKAYYNFNEDLQVIGGAFYRLQDAVVIMAGIKYRNLIFQSSYDINISDLNTYTNHHGGFEFSIFFINPKIGYKPLM